MNKSGEPFVVTLLSVLSLLSFLGGLVMAFALKPGDPGYGLSWETVAYLPSIIAITAGVVQFALLAALSEVVAYLYRIEFNTRKVVQVD